MKWNGVFSPTFKKSIGTVTYVPLTDMSVRDWDWLDYDGIRSTARNRLTGKISDGQMRGFFRVMIDGDTGKSGKNEYLWPASVTDLENFMQDETPDWFIHEAEIDSDSDATRAVERMRVNIGILPVSVLAGIVESLRDYMDDEQRRDADGARQEYLDSLDETAKSVVMSSIMLWLLSFEEAEALLDDMPESDEVDEVRDWINDRIDEVMGVGQQIAAGRGLTNQSGGANLDYKRNRRVQS